MDIMKVRVSVADDFDDYEEIVDEVGEEELDVSDEYLD